MKRLAWLTTIAMTMVLGCSNGSSGSGEEVDEGALEQNAPAAAAIGPSFTTISVENKMKAKEVDPNYAEMTECETNVDYLQIAGVPAAAAAKINAELKKSATVPSTCDYPESVDAKQVVAFSGKKVVSIRETGSWYSAGAAHPSFGITYKNFDLDTGELITLDKVVSAAGADTIVRSLRAQIGAKKDAQGQKLDETVKSVLLDAANSVKSELPKVDFSFSPSGVRVDLVNHLPHALQGADSEFLVRWKPIDASLAAGIKAKVTAK